MTLTTGHGARIPGRHHVCRLPGLAVPASLRAQARVLHPPPKGPPAPSQIRLMPLKRVTDGIEKSDGISLDSAAVFLISWQRPASAISPRACFDLTGARSHICTLRSVWSAARVGLLGFLYPLLPGMSGGI